MEMKYLFFVVFSFVILRPDNLHARDGINFLPNGSFISKYDMVYRRADTNFGPKVKVMYMGGAYLNQYTNEREKFSYERCKKSLNRGVRKIWIKAVGMRQDNIRVARLKIVFQNNEKIYFNGPFFIRNKTSVIIDLPRKKRCIKKIKIIGESDTWNSDSEAGFRIFGQP
jgi:hypothetical protein